MAGWPSRLAANTRMVTAGLTFILPPLHAYLPRPHGVCQRPPPISRREKLRFSVDAASGNVGFRGAIESSVHAMLKYREF